MNNRFVYESQIESKVKLQIVTNVVKNFGSK